MRLNVSFMSNESFGILSKDSLRRKDYGTVAIAAQGIEHGALAKLKILFVCLLIVHGEIATNNLYKTVKIQLRIE